jgi:hypothetical protein
MADVEMADADTGAAPVESKKMVKGSKSGAAETASDSKKRFEVKKVSLPCLDAWPAFSNDITVERSRAVGLGHCRRQLCYLPQSYHGPM